MQRGRGERDDFFGGGSGDPFAGLRSFGEPFAGFRGFGDPFGAFGGFGGPGSLASRFLGGRDPFDDPFFNRPFVGLMGPSIFPIGMVPQVSPFGEPSNTRFVQQQAPESNSSKGPIIKELNSDGEEEEEGNVLAEENKNTRFIQQQAPESNSSKGPIIIELNSDGEEEEGNAHAEEKKNNSRKHLRLSKKPYVEDPDEANQENKSKRMQFRNDFSRTSTAQPQAHTYSFQSSTVTYGGINGAYYTSSTTRRTGGDGVTLEESKEVDTSIGKATHMISRGIRDKGHSVTRKLNTNGRVKTMQMLHNLNEDELDGFEEAWKGNAKEHLPGWNQNVNILDQGNNGTSGQNEVINGRGWALPSTEQPYGSERIKSHRPNSSSRLSNGRTP